MCATDLVRRAEDPLNDGVASIATMMSGGTRLAVASVVSIRILSTLAVLATLLAVASPALADPRRIAVQVEGDKANDLRGVIVALVPEGVEVMGPASLGAALARAGLVGGKLGPALASKAVPRGVLEGVRRATKREGLAGAVLARLRPTARGPEVVLVYVEPEGAPIVDTTVEWHKDRDERRRALALALKPAFERLAGAQGAPVEAAPPAAAPPQVTAPETTPRPPLEAATPAPERQKPKRHAEPRAGDDGDAGASASEDDEGRLVWMGVSVLQEASLASGDGLCTKESQLGTGFVCFRDTGSQYHGTPMQGATLSVGPSLATTRLLLVADFATPSPVALGVRIGYAFRGGPTPDGGHRFIPFHGEARLSVFFARRAFSTSGFAPFAFIGGGIAQLDARYGVEIGEDTSAPPPANQLDNPPRQHLDVWHKSGPGLGTFGLGGFVATGAFHGFLFELKGSVFFPSLGGAAGLGAGYVLGV